MSSSLLYSSSSFSFIVINSSFFLFILFILLFNKLLDSPLLIISKLISDESFIIEFLFVFVFLSLLVILEDKEYEKLLQALNPFELLNELFI